MIPRQLPKLVTDALANGWSVHLETGRVRLAALFTSPAGDDVEIHWDAGKTVLSGINGTPTPYQQCTRLIRSKEN